MTKPALIILLSIYINAFIGVKAFGMQFSEIYSLSDKKEYTNMTVEEMVKFKEAIEYDITYDYSEADINGYNYSEFLEYFKPQNGIPSKSLLDKFEHKMCASLNKGIKEYNFNLGTPKSTNRFNVIVKFETITKDAKSIGVIIVSDKISGNIAFRKFSTKAGRWNDFEVLLIEDAENPYVNAPDKYSIQFVSQAIEYTIWFFRKKGVKMAKQR